MSNHKPKLGTVVGMVNYRWHIELDEGGTFGTLYSIPQEVDTGLALVPGMRVSVQYRSDHRHGWYQVSAAP